MYSYWNENFKRIFRQEDCWFLSEWSSSSLNECSRTGAKLGDLMVAQTEIAYLDNPKTFTSVRKGEKVMFLGLKTYTRRAEAGRYGKPQKTDDILCFLHRGKICFSFVTDFCPMGSMFARVRLKEKSPGENQDF